MRRSHKALQFLRQEHPEWRSVVIRSRRYLNNIVEQDHRAIKRRCAPMLALKSFRAAAVTLAGVDLAHRIRKRQFSFGRGSPRRFSSLKDLWARALVRHDAATTGEGPLWCRSTATAPELRCLYAERERGASHQAGALFTQGVGWRGFVSPKGGRCWRYAYRFARKYKTLALGTYPDVPLDRARSRHKFARNLLAHGLDPSALKAALGKQIFAATMGEWEIARGHVSAPPLGGHE